MVMNKKDFLKLLLAILVSESAGFIGAFFTTPSIPTWYATLAKPALNPPAWVFGPVWTTLFALMGVALYLVWEQHSNVLQNEKVLRWWKVGIVFFFIQLVLNTFWSIVFFGMRNPGGAFIEIIFLWLAILVTIVGFSKVSKPAAWLLVPYIFWVTFAGYLNYSIWQLNIGQEAVFCTADVQMCADGSYVGRLGPSCEFAACPDNLSLPAGYTLDSYKVEKISEISCVRKSDCETPVEYLLQSRCPFTSLCLQNKCAVVCPSYGN